MTSSNRNVSDCKENQSSANKRRKLNYEDVFDELMDIVLKTKHDRQNQALLSLLSCIDRHVLSQFIADHCSYDLSKLDEFIRLSDENLPDIGSGLQWINGLEDTNPAFRVYCEFTNEYFLRFKDLKRLQIEKAMPPNHDEIIMITKDLFHLFRDKDNSLMELIIEECRFSDEIDIEFMNTFITTNNANNKLENIVLWEWKYHDTQIHQMFTNYLLSSPMLKHVQIRVHKFDLSPVVHSKLEHIHFMEVSATELFDLINDKHKWIQTLRNCQCLKHITLDVTSILLERMGQCEMLDPSIAVKRQELTPETTKIVKGVIQLMHMFKRLFHELHASYHQDSDTIHFGKLTVTGPITPYFITLYNADQGDTPDEDTAQLESFEMGFCGKHKLIQLLDTKLMKLAKNIKIKIFDSILIKQMLDTYADFTLDMALNNMVSSFGIAFFFFQCIVYKEYSELDDQDIVIIETLNDQNKHKLQECLPLYFQMEPENAETKQNEEPENEAKDEETEGEQDEGDRTDLNQKVELLNEYDLNVIHQTIVHLFHHMIDNEERYEACLQVLVLQHQVFHSNKAMKAAEMNLLKVSTMLQLAQTKSTCNVDQLMVHFHTIHAFLGDAVLKQTLYFVNKQLFTLSANALYKRYATYLYKNNALEWSTDAFLSITQLSMNHLKIDREDLHPLSLLKGMQLFRVGLVEYCKWDRITTFDVEQCFSKWTNLESLNLWHYNDDAGSKYHANPTNAHLTETLISASKHTLKSLHVAFYDKEFMYSRWVKKTDSNGHHYYKYLHYSDDKENKHELVYPDFSGLKESSLEMFSFWCSARNQQIMDDILYQVIKQVKTIKTIFIQFEASAWNSTAPNDDFSDKDFKALILKYKEILVSNGENKTFYGTFAFKQITLKWLDLIIDNDKNDWFWNKDGDEKECNIECLQVESTYEDVEWGVLEKWMDLKKEPFVDQLCLTFLAPLSLDYRTWGKMVLLRGFYTQRGYYQNEVILMAVNKNNLKNVQSQMLQYIEKIDDKTRESNFKNEVKMPSIPLFGEEYDYDHRNSDYYD